MSTMTRIKEVQDGYFDTVKRVEEPMVRFTERIAEPVAHYVPERPTYLAELPTMTELVENQLKFQRRFVDQQAAFVRQLLKAMHPVVVKLDAVVETPKATSTKTAPRATKSRAKKAA